MQIKHPNDPASDAQVSFLRSLVEGREVEDKWRTAAHHKIDAGLSKGEAGKMIDWFNAQPKRAAVRVQVGSPVPARFQTTTTLGVLPKGVYTCMAGGIYVVKVAKTTGRPYAMKWAGTRYIYDSSHYRVLVANTPRPLTVEEAAKAGIDSGFCIICGLALTDEKSVAKGIGPVCEKNQRALHVNP